jgi:hypothetical protein
MVRNRFLPRLHQQPAVAVGLMEANLEETAVLAAAHRKVQALGLGRLGKETTAVQVLQQRVLMVVVVVVVPVGLALMAQPHTAAMVEVQAPQQLTARLTLLAEVVGLISVPLVLAFLE